MPRALTLFALLQFPLASAALLASVFYPAQGAAAALIAPGSSSPVSAIHWAYDNDIPVLGISPDGTFAIVRLSPSANAWDAIGHGFIPVVADAAGCVPSRGNERE